MKHNIYKNVGSLLNSKTPNELYRSRRLFLLLLILLVIPVVNAYIFSYPNSYNWYGNIYKTNTTFFKQFYNYTPKYLKKNLEINFVNQLSYSYDGYIWCYNKPYGKIKIIIYFNAWITKNFENRTINLLEHELKHAYQCRILNEYSHHGESFYKIKLK